jgi:hypothetical protein
MYEEPVEELKRRAKRLLALDGVWVDEDIKELILEGWSRWPIVFMNVRVDDLNETVYLSVYYDTPVPEMVLSENPIDDAHPVDHDGTVYVPEILDALRRRMLLDDLADV